MKKHFIVCLVALIFAACRKQEASIAKIGDVSVGETDIRAYLQERPDIAALMMQPGQRQLLVDTVIQKKIIEIRSQKSGMTFHAYLQDLTTHEWQVTYADIADYLKKNAAQIPVGDPGAPIDRSLYVKGILTKNKMAAWYAREKAALNIQINTAEIERMK